MPSDPVPNPAPAGDAEWDCTKQGCCNIDEMGRLVGTVAQLYSALRLERSRAKQAEADRDALRAALAEVRAREEKLRETLEFIAEEHDAGRHDGLPEPCPAHEADTMWAVACAALAPPTTQVPAPSGVDSDETETGGA